jgi:pyruvate,orthophosphate dikinase
MLGTRGVRLGVVKPGLYAMQVRALMEAARQRVADGGHPIVEIMIPLTVSREELALARSWVERPWPPWRRRGRAREAPSRGRQSRQAGGSLEVTIGTMIETPRAALLAGEIAEVADFFSFGTNDLTQMTFGFSRDDVEGRMMSAYLELGLLKRNPFEVVDPTVSASWCAWAPSGAGPPGPRSRSGSAGARGRPRVHRLFYDAGLDYVSCSPFRVPVARLAAAQAVLAGDPRRAKAPVRRRPRRRKAP